MITGTHMVAGGVDAIREKLRMLLAAANCQVTSAGPDVLDFRHGTHLTSTASLLPKRGRFRMMADGDRVRIQWAVQVAPFPRVWLTLVAVLTCWVIFPPLLVYHSLIRLPRRFMENLLAGL